MIKSQCNCQPPILTGGLNDWKRVSGEVKPDEDSRILVGCNTTGEKYVTIAHYRDGVFLDGDTYEPLRHVTHFMELPELPE